jgi:hypothetical protein
MVSNLTLNAHITKEYLLVAHTDASNTFQSTDGFHPVILITLRPCVLVKSEQNTQCGIRFLNNGVIVNNSPIYKHVIAYYVCFTEAFKE